MPDDRKAHEAYEEHNVHEVYQQIAQHFSSTRYKVGLSLCSVRCASDSTHSSAVACCGTFLAESGTRCCWARCGMRQWQVFGRQ